MLAHQVRRHNKPASAHALEAMDERRTAGATLGLDELDLFLKPCDARRFGVANLDPRMHFAFIRILELAQIQNRARARRRQFRVAAHPQAVLDQRVVFRLAMESLNADQDCPRGGKADQQCNQDSKPRDFHAAIVAAR